jgi:hypothetical protein
MRLFITLALIQLLLAGCSVINEANSVSSGPIPLEHVASCQRIILFSTCAVISVLASLAFFIIKPLSDSLPSFKVIFLISILPLALGIILSHYFSRLGFCCETPYTYFFGFPFSGLIGIVGDNLSQLAYAHYSNYGLLDILFRSGLHLSWSIQPIHLFLNITFWLNSSFIVCGLGAFLIRPIKK